MFSSSKRERETLLLSRLKEEMKGLDFKTLVMRLLFVTPFMVSVWQMYNILVRYTDDATKNELLASLLTSKNGEWTLKIIDPKTIVALSITLNWCGSLQFLVVPWVGAFLLLFQMVFVTPLFSNFDFYNYGFGEPIFWELLHNLTQHLSFCVALLFVFVMDFKPLLIRAYKRQAEKKKLEAKKEQVDIEAISLIHETVFED